MDRRFQFVVAPFIPAKRIFSPNSVEYSSFCGEDEIPVDNEDSITKLLREVRIDGSSAATPSLITNGVVVDAPTTSSQIMQSDSPCYYADDENAEDLFPSHPYDCKFPFPLLYPVFPQAAIRSSNFRDLSGQTYSYRFRNLSSSSSSSSSSSMYPMSHNLSFKRKSFQHGRRRSCLALRSNSCQELLDMFIRDLNLCDRSKPELENTTRVERKKSPLSSPILSAVEHQLTRSCSLSASPFPMTSQCKATKNRCNSFHL